MKIFVIGFNKTATTSIDAFFRACGLRTFHWQEGGVNLASQIKLNLSESKGVLTTLEDFEVYSDFTYVTADEVIEGNKFFRELHSEYPDAYFILNRRKDQDWILSRLRHPNFIERYSKALGLNIQQTLDYWIELKQSRELEIVNYFVGNPKFLDFNIDDYKVHDLTRLMGLSVDFPSQGEFFLNKTNL